MPLGVCLLVSIVVFVLFQRLQSARRKDYKVNLDHSNRTIENMEHSLKNREETIKSREARIFELETKLFSNGSAREVS